MYYSFFCFLPKLFSSTVNYQSDLCMQLRFTKTSFKRRGICIYFIALLIFRSLDKFLLLRQSQFFFTSLSSRIFKVMQFFINHLMKLFPA